MESSSVNNGSGEGDVESVNSESTTHFLNDLLGVVKKRFKQHSLASSYFKRLNMLCSFPSLIITMTSSILSFLSSSKYVTNENHKINIELSIGIVGVISFMLQSFAAGLNYGRKSEAHLIAATQYDMLMTKVRFDQKDHGPDTIPELEKQILDIKQTCKHYIPEWIVEKTENEPPENANGGDAIMTSVE